MSKKELGKCIPITSLKKTKAWKLTSEVVRRIRADQWGLVYCFTCNKRLRWQEMDAGHYIHNKAEVFFDLDNLRPQCRQCNFYGQGAQALFAENLIIEIGMERVQTLRRKSKDVKRWREKELTVLEESLKDKLKDINKGQ